MGFGARSSAWSPEIFERAWTCVEIAAKEANIIQSRILVDLPIAVLDTAYLSVTSVMGKKTWGKYSFLLYFSRVTVYTSERRFATRPHVYSEEHISYFLRDPFVTQPVRTYIYQSTYKRLSFVRALARELNRGRFIHKDRSVPAIQSFRDNVARFSKIYMQHAEDIYNFIVFYN